MDLQWSFTLKSSSTPPLLSPQRFILLHWGWEWCLNIWYLGGRSPQSLTDMITGSVEVYWAALEAHPQWQRLCPGDGVCLDEVSAEYQEHHNLWGQRSKVYLWILLQAVGCWDSEPGIRAPEIPNRAPPCDWSRKQPSGGNQWPTVNYNLTRLNEGFTFLIWKHGEYFELDDCIHCLSTHTELAKSSCSCESLLPIWPLQMSLVWSLLWHAKSVLRTDNQWWSWVWSSKYCFSIMTLGEVHTLRA